MAGPTFLLLGLLAGIASANKGNYFGGDDVGSMPDAVSEDLPSLMMMGMFADVQAAILDVQGPGEVKIREVFPGSGRVIAEFEGSLSVALDASVLTETGVHVLFGVGTTFAGGSADVYAHGAWSKVDELMPLAVRELPLSFLANEVSPTLIHADAVDGREFAMFSTAIDGAVLVRQIAR